MTSRPLSNLTVGAAGSTALDVRDWLHQFNDWAGQLPGAQPIVAYEIAANAVTPDRFRFRVDTALGATNQDLTTINTTNLPVGSLIQVSSVDASRVPVLKHATTGAGHIRMRDSADFPLTQQSIWIVFERTGEGWLEVNRWYGSQRDLWRAFFGLSEAATKPLATIAEAEAGQSLGLTALMSPETVEAAMNHSSRMITNKPTATALAATNSLLLSQAGVLTEGSMAQVRTFARKWDHQLGPLIIASGANRFTHPMGVKPSSARFRLVVTTATGNFAVDDEVAILSWDSSDSGDRIMAYGFNATHVWLSTPGTSGYGTRDPITGGIVSIPWGNLGLVVELWKDF